VRKILWLILLLAAGCAPWVEVGGLYKSDSQSYSVQLPQGWMRWNHGEQLLITRDGIPLQMIQIIRRNIDVPLTNTKKKISRKMLPQELSEVVLDDIASNKDYTDYSLIENGPLTVGGMAGFKAIYGYKTRDRLKVKTVYCGFIREDWFYAMIYYAPRRYYFDKDIGAFEEVLQSFKWSGSP